MQQPCTMEIFCLQLSTPASVCTGIHFIGFHPRLVREIHLGSQSHNTSFFLDTFKILLFSALPLPPRLPPTAKSYLQHRAAYTLSLQNRGAPPLTAGPTWTSCQVSPPCVCQSWPPPARTPRRPPDGSASSSTCSPGLRCTCPAAWSATLAGGEGGRGGSD